MNPGPYCTDCRYHRLYVPEPVDRCAHWNVSVDVLVRRDPPGSALESCRFGRLTKCGPTGKLFESKEARG